MSSWNEVDEAVFSINGTVYRVSGNNNVKKSLNSYLRNDLRLTDTKVMCREGSCGSCVVNIVIRNPYTKKQQTLAVNSCLLPVLACHGSSVTTVQGIGNRIKGYNKVQSTLSHFNGTQCGFCSPGFVMTMYSLLQNNPNATVQDVEDSFNGNLCRCTGYRPILDAFKSLASNPPSHLKRRLLDIEECHSDCPKQGSQCQNCPQRSEECEDMSLDFTELSLCKERLHVTESGKEWYRVSTIKEIFEVILRIGNKSYQLVAGNTSTGVQVKQEPPVPQVYIDINNVKELKEVRDLSSSYTLGAGTTLADFITNMEQLAKNRKNFSYAAQIAKHLKLAANVPVRNRATIGGNLYFAHEHGDFASDVILLLDAVSATINLDRIVGSKSSLTPTEFRSTKLKNTVIRSITLHPATSNQHLISYKVMQAAQSIIATVNAAFFYDVSNSGAISGTPTIVYSGINDKFRRAVKTEAYLKGKNIYSRDTLKNSLQILSSEIIPDNNPVSFSPEYRKQLALSLLYKSLLSLNSTKAEEKYQSGSEVLIMARPISSGKQVNYTDEKEWPVTQPIPKLESLIQCAGEAVYTKDLSACGMMSAKLILADQIGDIESIDASKALALKGVKGFYTSKDIPGVNNVIYPSDNKVEPEELFCSGHVLYCGQQLGVIVAVDEETASEAAKLVKTTYKTVRKPILTNIKDVLKSKETADRVVERNSFEPTKTGGDQKYKFNGEFMIGSQYSHSMETQSCFVTPLEDGQYLVNSATQCLPYVANAISQVLDIPINKIDLDTRRLGGAFGSKIEAQLLSSTAAALAASKLNKPVKLSLSLPDDILSVGRREAFYAKYQGAINDKGEIQSLNIEAYYDVGCQMTPGYYHPFDALPTKIKNYFDASTWKFKVFSVFTDKPPAVIARSPIYSAGFNLIEQIMEHAAFASHNDPIQIRLINSNDETIKKYIKDWRKSTQYDSRKDVVDKFNETNRWKKRGISLSAMKYFIPIFSRYIGCSVSIMWPDASVQIIHGGIEMGQGINTKVAQVVAKVLGVDLKVIQVKSSTSYVTPNNQPTEATMSSDLASYAALRCCNDLNSRIEPVRKTMSDPNDWKTLVNKLYTSGVDLNSTYASGFPESDSALKDYNIYGVNVTEVEIDVLTGERQILRTDLLQDVGNSISPEVDVGQVEGAFIMGLGLNTLERVVVDPNTGKLLNDRLWSYKIPTSKDIPIDFRITFIPNTSNPTGVFGSKGTGEPGLVLSVGVVNAYRNACIAARMDAGQGNNWLLLDSPVTIETIAMSTGTTPEQFSF